MKATEATESIRLTISLGILAASIGALALDHGLLEWQVIWAIAVLMAFISLVYIALSSLRVKYSNSSKIGPIKVSDTLRREFFDAMIDIFCMIIVFAILYFVYFVVSTESISTILKIGLFAPFIVLYLLIKAKASIDRRAS